MGPRSASQGGTEVRSVTPLGLERPYLVVGSRELREFSAPEIAETTRYLHRDRNGTIRLVLNLEPIRALLHHAIPDHKPGVGKCGGMLPNGSRFCCQALRRPARSLFWNI